jgi:transglutaminase-like putative cysteine protease/Flp pilus assembly protein TadD
MMRTVARFGLSLPLLSLSFLCAVSPSSFAADDAPASAGAATRFQADVRALYKASSAIKTADGTDVLVLADEARYVFESDGRALHTQYLLYKVLTQKGAQDWDEVSSEWEPWHEARPGIRARVITPDNAVHTLDPKTIADTPAKEDSSDAYSDRRVLRAPLPAIAPGSLVEEELTWQDTAPFFGAGTVDSFYVGRGVPVEHTRLTLEAPSSFPLRYDLQMLPDLKPQRTESSGRVEIIFDSGPTEMLEDADDYLPNDAPAFPHITFSTGSTWKQISEEYGKIVDTKLAGADVKATVDKLIAGKKSREEKAAAILQYVDREVRYTGIEFGDAAIVPHSPTDTLKQKYGDCKDKATLLVAMLRAADVPAFVALLNAGSREDVAGDLPGIGQFDHAIVYAPGAPDLWIDATDEYARLGQLPSSDQGRLALVVRPDSNALISTPITAAEDNLLVERREFYLAENGPARIVEVSQPHGNLESEYRSYYVDKENKDRKEGLTRYLKSQYLAEKLERVDRTDPTDLSGQFELTLEGSKVRRGFTELDNAVAVIRLDSLFDRLPSELQERENTDEKAADAANSKPKKKRTADYQLPEAFVTEWRYKIVPPTGFRPKPLPQNAKLTLGPALLTEEFSTEQDGTVQALLRFDTVKRRLNVAEATELRNHLADLRDGEAVLIYFEPVAQALLNEGKIRESFQSYRDLISLHPREAVHHLQIAKALLSAGMGEAARAEVKRAVALEPTSALAQRTLAEILEYDLVGRKFRHGSDYAGAEAAFRAAMKLDPDDKSAAANLAILLEHNTEGERYGRGARLKEAIAQYRTLKPEELADMGLKNNLAYALLYAGQFDEARKAAEGLNPQELDLIVACEAGKNGAQAAIAEARKRTTDESRLKQIVKTAGQIMLQMQHYPAAADLFQAGASDDNASAAMAFASMLRKTRPRTEIHYNDDPTGLALQLFALMADANLTAEKMKAFSSRNALAVTRNEEKEQLDSALKAGRQLRGMFARTGLPPDAMIDVTLQVMEPKAEGDDANGYRVALRVSGNKSIAFYIVKEDGKYKILDTSEKSNSIGLEILDRVNANNLAGARAMLDWLREDQHLAGGDDPLAGAAFPRLWTKGKEGSADQIKLAAAAILVDTKPTAQQGISILAGAKDAAKTDVDKLNISLALISGYFNVEDYDKLLAVASELAKQYPESRRAFLDESSALRALGRYPEADQLAQERLKRMPDDIDALRTLTANATAREDYALAHQWGLKIVAAGKAEPPDLNELAWHALFTGNVSSDDIENAVKAAQLSTTKTAELHTLGCVYAEIGKAKEAREVLVQSMDLLALDEPNSDYWYAFGRIAEQYGEQETAMANYARVTKPEKTIAIPSSSYRLAQNRLKILSSAPATRISASKN